jgi:nitrite reductase/ring-hydroxylating ferredoxin subunit
MVTAAGQPAPAGTTVGFTDLMLAGVILVGVTGVALMALLFVLPGERLDVPDLQRGARVARVADLPVGASRVVSWGERIILVVRDGDETYAALQGTSPIDGCMLEWDAEAARVASPCSDVTYDLHGNVVAGLTTRPLHRYGVFLRGDVVYVGEEVPD